MQDVSCESYTIQSHALALFLIYFVYHYPWGWQNRDQLLKPACKKENSRFPSLPITRKVRSSSNSNDAIMVEDALLMACPAATPTERKRFLTARQGNLASATKSLNHYLHWHQTYVDVATRHKIIRPSTDNQDLDIWMECCQIAMKANNEKPQLQLPRVIQTLHLESGMPLTDSSGHRLFQILPAQMDISLASSSTYALAVALYLNTQLDRHATERIVVCLDVRAGRGWPNTHAVRLVPFMQQTTKLLLSLFPERLHKCLLYPVPPSFLWVWNTISKVVDPLTRQKISLLSGANKIESPPPHEQMCNHLPEEAVQHLEKSRVAAFC